MEKQLSIEQQERLQRRLGINLAEMSQFSQRWQIVELAFFGSVLRDDFREDSDVDVLVRFAPEHQWGLEFVRMRDELAELFHRKVDLVSHKSVEASHNQARRESILSSMQVIYDAR